MRRAALALIVLALLAFASGASVSLARHSDAETTTAQLCVATRSFLHDLPDQPRPLRS